MSDHSRGKSPFRMQLIDVAAIVVGYGLAALLFRAFSPQRTMSSGLGLFAAGFYAWLGMAMSGPLLLLRHRQAPPKKRPELPGDARAAASPRTWAETAWLLIGVYWIVMGVFVLPVRLHEFQVRDTILFGLVPLGAGLVFRFIKPPSSARGTDELSWTHHVAVTLLATWPLAWMCLIAVAQVIL